VSDPSRRDFLQTAAVLGLGATLAREPSGRQPAIEGTALFAAPPMERVRIGFVGVGGQGSVHVDNLLKIEGVEIKAICDIVEWKVARAQDAVVAADQPRPTGYARGPRDFERMCAEQDLELVFTATPWEWHVPVMLAAMQHGKHAATEVPAAMTVDDCWQLVETAEKLKKHCVMMENCCYDRREMLALHLVRRGMLGELLHAECGYLHDLRATKFAKEGEGLWRRAWSQQADGNLYPTHGLGPIAQCMDINRGNRFDYLVSMSSNHGGLEQFAAEHFAGADPRRAERFKLGDLNVTLIRTLKGQTIYLSHNTNNPRPYSRLNLLRAPGDPPGMAGPHPHRGPQSGSRLGAAHRVLRRIRAPAVEVGARAARHRRPWRDGFPGRLALIQCLRAGLPTDQNVCDAAAWSAIVELTMRSVANHARPQDVPDFTRGKWQTTPPLGIVDGGS
jgi:hypothetical protein